MSASQAFQAGSFQGSAFQTDPLPAFLGAAFERDAFQVGIGGLAFQSPPFCGDAFLAEQCPATRTAPPAGAIQYRPELPEDEDGVAAIAAALASWSPFT